MLPPEVDAVLDHTVGPSTYDRDDTLRAEILQHFEFNLRRMAETARGSGAELLLVTPAANLKDCAPFKSAHPAGWTSAEQARWLALQQAGQEAESQREWEAAHTAYEQALEIDGRYAETHYHLGLVLHGLGDVEAARVSFERAVDEDICPLRVLPVMQSIIETVARQQHLPLVDFHSILKADCSYHYGHPSPGAEYFLDHVHLTIPANGLLASGIMEALIQKGIVIPRLAWSDDAVAAVARRIESRVDAELQAMALRNLATVLSWAGKKDEAGVLAQQAVELRQAADLPEDPKSLFLSGVHLAMSGQNDQAILYLQKVVEDQPEHFEARWRLGQLLYDERRDEESLEHFVIAADLQPQDAYVQEMAGTLLARLGRHSEAIEYLVRAEALNPDESRVQNKLDEIREQLGR